MEPATRPIDQYDAPSLVGNLGQKRFHVMAKPVGSTCNLDCAYCFYLSKETLPGGPGTGRMSDEVLERFIQQYIAGVTGDEVVFSWQGGEPTLLGVEFFRKIVALEKNSQGTVTVDAARCLPPLLSGSSGLAGFVIQSEHLVRHVSRPQHAPSRRHDGLG